MRTARSEIVRAPAGVDLRVLRWPGREPGFVLVHGLASNARLWQGVAEILSGDGTAHAVTAIDLRGHGESAQPSTGYDTATAAADVAAVIRSLGLDCAVVAGQSWGGNVVVELAAAQPNVVAAIALVDGGWIQLRDTFSTWESVRRALTPPDMSRHTWTEMAAIMRGAHPDWDEWAIEATLANLHGLPDGGVRGRLALDHHLSILRSMWDRPISERFSEVRVPSLLMPAGARVDPKRAAVDRAAAALRQSEIRWYEGADHDIHAQHPRALAQDLLDLADRPGLGFGRAGTAPRTHNGQP